MGFEPGTTKLTVLFVHYTITLNIMPWNCWNVLLCVSLQLLKLNSSALNYPTQDLNQGPVPVETSPLWLDHCTTDTGQSAPLFFLITASDFGHFLKSFKIMKNTGYSMCLETMSYSRLRFHGFHRFLKFSKIERNDIAYYSMSFFMIMVISWKISVNST